MLENLHFTYDGKSSRDFGVQLVNPSGGLYKEQFLPNRKIVETKVAGRHSSFFHRVDDDPLSFSLHIYLGEWEKRNNLRQISRWLYQDYYKPLIFESNPDVVYYAMIEGKSELTHNGLFNGYISLNIRMNSPYCYSIPHEDSFTVNSSKSMKIYNNGDLPMRMKMEITKNGNGNISIVNNRNGDRFELNNLLNREIVYVDCPNEYLSSSLEKSSGRYLVDNHNDVWLDIEAETDATLSFNGNFSIKLTYEYAYLNVDNELIGKVGGNF